MNTLETSAGSQQQASRRERRNQSVDEGSNSNSVKMTREAERFRRFWSVAHRSSGPLRPSAATCSHERRAPFSHAAAAGRAMADMPRDGKRPSVPFRPLRSAEPSAGKSKLAAAGRAERRLCGAEFKLAVWNGRRRHPAARATSHGLPWAAMGCHGPARAVPRDGHRLSWTKMRRPWYEPLDSVIRGFTPEWMTGVFSSSTLARRCCTSFWL